MMRNGHNADRGTQMDTAITFRRHSKTKQKVEVKRSKQNSDFTYEQPRVE